MGSWYDKLKGKGLVRNFSSKSIIVVETDTGVPKTHILNSLHKSPQDVDTDGFRREDGGAINGHKTWWKLPGRSMIRIFDDRNNIDFSEIAFRVKDDEFNAGSNKSIPPTPDNKSHWSIRMNLIVDIRVKSIQEIEYFVDNLGWMPKERAVQLVNQGQIDNAVLVQGRGQIYIRSWPDKFKFNNFSNLKN